LLTFGCQIGLAHNMKSELDEKALVESILLKDRAAFEKLVREYEGLVFHIVMPLIKDEKDREDICQDVFLKVYEKLHTFQFR
jgi:DNA-directed RNA polymerase specialized sigma24 family protein